MQDDRYIAIFNYDNKEQVFRVPLLKGGLVTELFSKEKMSVRDTLEVKLEGGSAAIYKIGITKAGP